MTKHKSESLADFFNSIGGEKKKLKEEKSKIIGDLSLDNLFSSMEEESRKIKEEKKQLKKDVEAFKNLLFKEEKKEEKPSVDEYIEPPRPEEEIADAIRQSENNKEETVVEHAVKILDKINEEVETVETEPDLAKLKKEIEVLKQVVYEQGGGGEVRLEFLDDVDRDSVKVDGKFLKYQSSTGKFIGGDASGGSGIGTNGSVNTVGIITAAQFSGFTHLSAPYSSTTTITVTVANKIDGEHRYYGQGSSQGYVLDNVQAPFLTLTPGKTYRFSGSVGGVHPFRFYYDADKNYAYTTGVTVGSGYVDLEVTDTTPTVLHYQCSSHALMGNAVQINSNYVDVKSNASFEVLTATSLVGGLTGNVIGNVTGNVSGTSGSTTGNAATATKLATARTIGGVSFDGSAAINLPGVNTSGNQDTSGNAATATALETARTIGGVSFDGSASINLPGVNSSGNQDTSGNAATATVATNAQGLTGTPSISVVDISSRHINSSGVVTATSFVGDGSGLTGVASTDNIITGTAATFNNTVNFNSPILINKGVSLTGVTTGLNVSGVGTIGTLQVTNATISGNLSIGGTLTYEDVTSIDSVGLITARSGMVVSGVSTFLGSQKGINVSGISTFTGTVGFETHVTLKDYSRIQLGEKSGGDFFIGHNPTLFGGVYNELVSTNGNILLENRDTGSQTRNLFLKADEVQLRSYSTNESFVTTKVNQWVKLFYNNSEKLVTTNTGITVTGTAVATSFTGDLTGNADTATVSVNAQGLTGSPNIQVGNVTVTGDLTVQGTTNSETSTDTTVTGIMTARSVNVGAVGGIGVTFDQGGGVFSGIVTSHTVKASNALYLPLYTTTTRDAGSFTQGAVIFNTTVKKLEYYDGDNWKTLPEVTTGLSLALS